MSSQWLFTGVPRSVESGGTARAAYIFSDAIDRTRGRTTPAGFRGLPARLLGGIRPGLQIAAANFAEPWLTALEARTGRLRVLDVHDHPAMQMDALGFALPAGRRRALDRLFTANVTRFEALISQTEAFAELCSLPGGRTIVIPNGTDTDLIQPGSWPAEPRIAVASGAAPGRGLEALLEAFRMVATEVPDASLTIALAVTGIASAAYRTQLMEKARQIPRVSFTQLPYRQVGAFLNAAQLVVIPHPRNEYMDAVLPVKLFDAFAAGRPVVATRASRLRHW